MTDLPSGWEWVRLGDLLAELRNGVFASRPGLEDTGRPILRISAVRSMAIDLQDVRYIPPTVNIAKESDFYIGQDDLLFTRYSGSPEFVGVCARVRSQVPRLLYPDKLIRGRVKPGVAHPAYIEAAMSAPQTRDAVRLLLKTTAGQIGISGASLRAVSIPLAPYDEQERIAAAIEEQFSRLDAGVSVLQRAQRNVARLTKSIILSAIPDEYPEHWKRVTVADAGEVMLGRQRSPKYHNGPNMRPYLRVANVFEDRIDISDVMSMHFDDDEFARYLVRPGDILLNEGQSPHLLGRPAIYRGNPPNVAFTNSLLRFRAGPLVLPAWALLVFRRHMHAKRFMRESRITTNIAHLSASRFKSVEFPIPPIREQKSIVAATEESLAETARIAESVEIQLSRANRMRSAILASAFAGHLISQGN